MPFDKANIYVRSDETGEFWQGEILSQLVEVHWQGPSAGDVVLVNHPLAIICSADCDLTQDCESRKATPPAPDQQLRNVLCCDLEAAASLRERRKDTSAALNAKIWSNIVKNKSERYHYFSEVTKASDLQADEFPALIADFKLCFCVSTLHLLRQVDEDKSAKRRCRLSPPFAQHFAQRFFNYQARIGLPIEHDAPSAPPPS